MTDPTSSSTPPTTSAASAADSSATDPGAITARVRQLVASWPITPRAGWLTYVPPKMRVRAGHPETRRDVAKAMYPKVDGSIVELPPFPTKAHVFAAMVLYLSEWASPRVAVESMLTAVGAPLVVLSGALQLSGVGNAVEDGTPEGRASSAKILRAIVDEADDALYLFLHRLAVLALPDADAAV